MFCWLVSDEAANFATVMTWLTTFGAVLIAWRQFKSWKTQQTSLKKSEAAGRFYVAVSNLMEAIKTLAAPFINETFDDLNATTDHEEHLKRAIAKQGMVQEYVKSFNDSRSEAEVYLEELSDETEDLWKLYTDVHYRLLFSLPEAMKHGRIEEVKEHRKIIYDDSKDKIKQFETTLRDPLKKIARMEQEKKKAGS